jgi:hypothetical protein
MWYDLIHHTIIYLTCLTAALTIVKGIYSYCPGGKQPQINSLIFPAGNPYEPDNCVVEQSRFEFYTQS